MLNRTRRRPANMMKKRVALTDSAPEARTKGRSGKGGGSRAGRTSATAPLCLTLRITLSNRMGETQCSSVLADLAANPKCYRRPYQRSRGGKKRQKPDNLRMTSKDHDCRFDVHRGRIVPTSLAPPYSPPNPMKQGWKIVITRHPPLSSAHQSPILTSLAPRCYGMT